MEGGRRGTRRCSLPHCVGLGASLTQRTQPGPLIPAFGVPQPPVRCLESSSSGQELQGARGSESCVQGSRTQVSSYTEAAWGRDGVSSPTPRLFFLQKTPGFDACLPATSVGLTAFPAKLLTCVLFEALKFFSILICSFSWGHHLPRLPAVTPHPPAFPLRSL